MKRYCVIAYIILIIIVMAYGVARINTGIQDNTVRLKILFGRETNEPGVASLKITASYHILVYDSNGNVKAERHKENDPISIQWYRMVANMMFGFVRSDALTWYDIKGNSYQQVDTGCVGESIDPSGVFDPKVYIVLGNGSGTPSIYGYKMFSEVTKDLPSMTVTDDTANSQYIVTYTKTFTVTTDFTLTEVGLELYADATYSGGTLTYLLIAHDSVSPSISLVAGDSVSVTYQLTIPYNTNGPFTRWFYNALINYWLGYKGTTGSKLTLRAESGGTGGIDTGPDYGNIANRVDGEYIYIEIGSDSSTISPLFETYTLASLLQRGQPDIMEVNETDSYQIKLIESYTFTSSASITEIGVSYYTDIVGDCSDYSGNYYLWLYWSLPSAIDVGANDGLRVEVTIEIPYT